MIKWLCMKQGKTKTQIRCHYEVARIYIRPAHTAIGVDFEEAEVFTSNEKFFYDGSGLTFATSALHWVVRYLAKRSAVSTIKW